MDLSRWRHWRDRIVRRARALGRRVRAAALEALRALRRLPRGTARVLRFLAIALAALLLAVLALDALLDEPIRASVERRMNGALHGYSVRVGGADFSPWNFSLELDDLAVRQAAHPEPAVLVLPALRFSVQWRALFRGRLVADAVLDEPRLHVHLAQLREERDDDVDLDRRGWQEAIEEAYPLRINELRIAGGSVTYVDEDPDRPLEITGLRALATNLRNVRPEPGRHPSEVHASARVFDSGSARLDGRADFLAKPSPAFVADLRIDSVPLARLGPVIEDYRLQVTGGELSAHGRIASGPEGRRADLGEVVVAGVRVDYVSDPELTRRAVEAVAEAGREPGTEVHVGRLRVVDGEVGFVNRARDPGYRVFVSGLDATLDDWSNRPGSGASRFRAQGAFMGSGRTAIRGAFRPDVDGADFDLAVAIEGTRLESMNDLLRTYANLDVTDGTFSFYSELRVGGGRIDGYVKPLFHEVDVYDPEQDRHEGFFHRLWERLAEGLGEILENRPRDDVATVADISGPVSDPSASNLQVVLNLIENAFFDAILPGFQHEAGRD